MSAALRTLVLVHITVAAADWIDEYELSAHRAVFEAEGLRFQDLVHIDTNDTACFADMKKFEKMRFKRAIDNAHVRHPKAMRNLESLRQLTSGDQTDGDRRARALQQPLAATLASHETNLKEQLLRGTSPVYDKTVSPPPLTAGTNGASVQLGLNLYHVYKVDTPRTTVALHVWLRLAWHDARLAWDPAQYGGIDQVTFVAGVASLEESQVGASSRPTLCPRTSTLAPPPSRLHPRTSTLAPPLTRVPVRVRMR